MNFSKPRLLLLLASFLLIGLYLFPLWRITLEAAQFPGGLRLNIWISKFSGDEGGGNIINNINILNHYIGMQDIEPDAIPELKYFPYVVGTMISLGVLFVAVDKTLGYFLWSAILSILALLAVYDFYLWLYDYGHNLDPMAPIKIEGMAFMPPVFGEKDLLNFYVRSYPRLGSIFLFLSVAVSGLACWIKWKDK